MQPLVSVIMPTRNRVSLLRRAVQSVLAQSEQNFELIIVDDASCDGTPKYLTELAAQDARVRVVRNEASGGGAAARNAGIAIVRGSWVAFIDDDDEWLRNKLERQLATLAARPVAVACSCNYIAQVESGKSRIVVTADQVTLRHLLTDNVLGGASMCICRAEVLRDIGGFDARFRSAQDLDLWVRLRERGEILTCREALVIHRAHAGMRITTNMQSQYLGARHFYFKHRGLMDASLRRHWVAYTSFIMSRQTQRGLRHRLRHLCRSLRWSRAPFSLAYLRSSAPRLFADALRVPLARGGALK